MRMRWPLISLVALIFPLRLWAYVSVTSSDQSPQDVFQNQTTPPDLHPASGTSFDQQWIQFLKRPAPRVPVTAGVMIDLSKLQVDWNALWILNQEADKAWTSLLNCAGGDAEKARSIYLDLPNECPEGAKKIKALRMAIQSFTSSSAYGLINLKNSLICSNSSCSNSLFNQLSESSQPDVMKSLFCTRESDCFVYSLNSTHQALRQLDLPPFHPLLTQMLFEQAAAGFPFLWAEHRCLLWSCLYEHDITIDNSPLFEFMHSSSHSQESRKKLAEEMINLFTKNDLSTEALTSSSLAQLRSSYVALRTLDVLVFGVRSCTQFGLWPTATGELIVAMGSWQGDGDGILLRSDLPGLSIFPDDLQMAYDRSCGNAPPALDWMHVYNWDADQDMNLRSGWNILTQAGAWRALDERNSQL